MEDEFETPPPSKLKAMLPYIGVLVVGLGGGFGASLAMPAGGAEDEDAEEPAAAHGEAAPAHGEEAEAPAAGHGEEAKAEAPAAGGHGAPPPVVIAGAVGHAAWITNLGTFTVNLRGSGGGRVLRMEVQLDAPEGDAAALEQLTPKMRDAVFTAVSDYTWAELEGADGKIRLKDELLTRLNGIADPVVVRSIYLTQFVVS